MKKKIFAMFMAVVLCVGVMPSAVLADVDQPADEFKAAIENAQTGDIVKLEDDIEVDCSEGNFVTVETAGITVDLGDHTIRVEGSSTSYYLFNITCDGGFTLQNGTIDGGLEEDGEQTASAKCQVLHSASSDNTTNINDVTIQYFASSNGAVYISKGSISIDGSNFLNNSTRGIYTSDCSDVSVSNSTVDGNSCNGDGGGIYISGTKGSVVLTNNKILNNVSKAKNVDGGGGFALDGTAGKITMEGNEVAGNLAHGNYGGGGLIFNSGSGFGDVSVKDNTFSNNAIAGEYYAYAYGGGLALFDFSKSHAEEINICFSGNTFRENEATNSRPQGNGTGRGGGLSLDVVDASQEIVIESGKFINNEADLGGGIDYTNHNGAKLILLNALVTGNSAQRGGGIWSCPSSTTTVYSTFGGAIYGNTASVEGDSIRFEGDDNIYGSSGSGGVFVSVSSRALGGGLMDWYADDAGNRYHAEAAPVDVSSERYKDTDQSFSLHGELNESSKELASAEAATYIVNNTAKAVGGGIASNATIDFGDSDAGEMTVTAVKKWVDEDGNEITADDLPKAAVEVTLVRVDEDGNKVDLETVTLEEENEWTHTFIDLPANYTYETREDSIVEGYESTYEITTDEDGNETIIITNTLKTIDLSGTKTWDDNDNKSGARPESITVDLLADGVVIDSVPVTDANDWNWSFTGLPKYKAGEEGTEITYTVTEEPVDDYTTKVTGDAANGFEIINTFTEPKITKEIAEDDFERKEDSGEEMHDGEDTYGDGWGSWDDADNHQEATYHLILTDIAGAHNLTVHDYLEDGLDFEPDTIEVDLYDEGLDTVLEEGTDYTEHEDACSDPNGCAMGGCTFEVAFEDSVFEDISVDAYMVVSYKALTDTHAGDYDDYEDDILNHAYMTYGIASYRTGIVTSETDLFGFGVYKYADQDGEEISLAGAEFVLERNGVYATFDVETDTSTGETYYIVSGWVENKDSAGALTSDLNGLIRIEGLDDDTYTITETKAPVGYEIVEETVTVVIDEDGNVTVSGDTGSKEAVTGHEVNVENELILVDIEGSKIWDDNENRDGARPESITIRLWCDGEIADSVTVTEADGWAWSFTDLPMYRDGEEIVYTVTEDPVEGYESNIIQKEDSTWEITNTVSPDTGNPPDGGNPPDNDNPPDSSNPPGNDNPPDSNNSPGNDNPGTTRGTTGGTGGTSGPGSTGATGSSGSTGGAGGTGSTNSAGTPSTTSSAGTAKTGDTGNAGPWLVLLVLAGACVVGSVTVRTRKTKQRRR